MAIDESAEHTGQLSVAKSVTSRLQWLCRLGLGGVPSSSGTSRLVGQYLSSWNTNKKGSKKLNPSPQCENTTYLIVWS